MDRRPTISIITAVRNGAMTIRDCLESVKSQTCSVEHIVLDGCSTDGTRSIIEEYRPGLARVITENDHGLYDALNKGIRLATGEVVGILHADDFYADSEVLSTVAEAFAAQEVESCYGDLLYVARADIRRVVRYWQAGPYHKRRFYCGWMPPHPTFFVRRYLYEKYGAFRLDLGSSADYELILRFLFKYEISTAYIPQVLVKMRSGGMSSQSLAKRMEANRMDRQAWAVNDLKPFPWTLWLKPVLKIPQFFSPFLQKFLKIS